MSFLFKSIFYKKEEITEDQTTVSNAATEAESNSDEQQDWQGGIYDSVKPKHWNTIVNQHVQLATFGAGCFWGTEKYFANDFAKLNPGSIIGTSVGFMNPDPCAARPSNQDKSGYIEVAHVLFDPSITSFEELCKFFYTFHDPTTVNR